MNIYFRVTLLAILVGLVLGQVPPGPCQTSCETDEDCYDGGIGCNACVYQEGFQPTCGSGASAISHGGRLHKALRRPRPPKSA